MLDLSLVQRDKQNRSLALHATGSQTFTDNVASNAQGVDIKVRCFFGISKDSRTEIHFWSFKSDHIQLGKIIRKQGRIC